MCVYERLGVYVCMRCEVCVCVCKRCVYERCVCTCVYERCVLVCMKGMCVCVCVQSGGSLTALHKPAREEKRWRGSTLGDLGDTHHGGPGEHLPWGPGGHLLYHGGPGGHLPRGTWGTLTMEDLGTRGTPTTGELNILRRDRGCVMFGETGEAEGIRALGEGGEDFSPGGRPW